MKSKRIINEWVKPALTALRAGRTLVNKYPKISGAVGSGVAYVGAEEALGRAGRATGLIKDQSKDVEDLSKRTDDLYAKQAALVKPGLIDRAKEYYKNNPNIKTHAKTALAGGAVVGAAVAGGAVLRDRLKKRNWIKSNCSNVTEPDEKSICMQYNKNYKLNSLKKQLRLCNNVECQQSVRNQITSLMNG
jgi:hypothetical protein